MSTGSLGVGLSTGVGMAIGAKRLGNDVRVFAMLGDGECQEGQVWEAAMSGVRFGLDNLFAIVDVNGLQQFGWVDPATGSRLPPWTVGALADIWTAFGWQVRTVDGHDMSAIVTAFSNAIAQPQPGKPTVFLAETIKGRGVSFMEGRYEWHARVPTPDDTERAITELERR
jgi:transketolase